MQVAKVACTCISTVALGGSASDRWSSKDQASDLMLRPQQMVLVIFLDYAASPRIMPRFIIHTIVAAAEDYAFGCDAQHLGHIRILEHHRCAAGFSRISCEVT